MGNTIQLMPVSSLLERQFFVPAYQRGYRWTSRQVTDLLEDIYSFAIKKNKADEEFYCLQPIVVKFDPVKKHYEIADGQQRLTTIRILLFYFLKKYLNGMTLKERYGKDLYKITYETRPGLEHFLDNIVSNEDNIEFFHVSKAYECVTGWFRQIIEWILEFIVRAQVDAVIHLAALFALLRIMKTWLKQSCRHGRISSCGES
ncbi:DUF262 domain-containing protein [Arcticibacter tournemirensis]|uniref:DUF262 domain-containing protein n=1 Tax=Arcticibacter tournemirensis TaxID=699437 RepID=UPI00192A23B0|nr:DUF262 domain-containing protein [Arcticibacter tournemirensis]